MLLLFCSLCLQAQRRPMLRPDYLKPGDTVALMSPASTPDAEFVTAAEDVLHQWGYNTVRCAHVLDSLHGSFAGTVEERKADLLQALRDPAVKAIFCTRGGYGSIQQMQEIPLDTLRRYPKWVIGYSDVTVMHSAWVSAGVMSIHAHMGEHLMNYGGQDSCSLALKGMLQGKLPRYVIPSDSLNCPGDATGVLIGGNLSVLSGFTGSWLDFFQRPEGLILFLEDVGEDFDHVDRYMNLLRLHDCLKNLRGVVIGQFNHFKSNGDYPDMNHLFQRYFASMGIPVIYNFPVGHVDENYPMMEGATVHLSVNREEALLEFLE